MYFFLHYIYLTSVVNSVLLRALHIKAFPKRQNKEELIRVSRSIK